MFYSHRAGSCRTFNLLVTAPPPTFFALLEKENEFGLVLGGLLITVIIVSSLFFVVGIKQYLSIKSWNKKYNIYSKKKDEIDRHIVSEYGLDEDQSKT